tara:strand:+ start:939 stop:1070 length:132 start_codon:yes stop_codon:yes gene_type:complete
VLKSAIKTVVPDTSEEDSGNNQLIKWVAILTGSKNQKRSWLLS